MFYVLNKRFIVCKLYCAWVFGYVMAVGYFRCIQFWSHKYNFFLKTLAHSITFITMNIIVNGKYSCLLFISCTGLIAYKGQCAL